jgi:hypothetical protein
MRRGNVPNMKIVDRPSSDVHSPYKMDCTALIAPIMPMPNPAKADIMASLTSRRCPVVELGCFRTAPRHMSAGKI